MNDRYTIQDNTVLDTTTDLEWQRKHSGPMTWQAAMAYATSLGDGWRLPTLWELLSLVDFKQANPSSMFPNMPQKSFWSSSSYGIDPTPSAWHVYFNAGHVDPGDKSYGHYVRCVRTRSRVGS